MYECVFSFHTRIRVTEPNIVATQRQKWQDAVGPGREPQVRRYSRTPEQRDQEEKEVDDTSL